jgi:hypothetical protein
MNLEQAITVFRHKLRLVGQGRSIESLQLYDAMMVLLREVTKEGPKRNNYFLFAGDAYYPAGPNDLIGAFQTLAECHAEGERLIDDPNEHFIRWYAILDVDKGKFIGTKGEWYGDGKT